MAEITARTRFINGDHVEERVMRYCRLPEKGDSIRVLLNSMIDEIDLYEVIGLEHSPVDADYASRYFSKEPEAVILCVWRRSMDLL